MTPKRFNYEYVDDKFYDKGFFLDNGKRMFKDEVVNILNGLHEENKKLKQVKEMLQIDFAMTERNLIEENEQLKRKMEKVYNSLVDENEQLKTDIRLHIDDSEKYRKLSLQFDNRNKELISENVLLEEENEQLKCGNKNLKATLNDFINILNRLQSNPNDKQILGVARDMLQNMGKELE